MSTTIITYAEAIVAGNMQKIAGCFIDSVKLFPPGAFDAIVGIDKASQMLSTAAVIIKDLKSGRSYADNHGWYVVLFEGTLDDTPIQIIDQVHINENDLIDRVEIFLRPTSMADILLNKVGAALRKQTAGVPV